MTNRTDAYHRAYTRVTMDSDLLPYSDICLYDWPEGDEHWNWIADAPSREIVDWAQDIRTEQEEATR